MDFSKLNELKTGNLILRKLSEKDRQAVSNMFEDSDIRKFYIVPKEARQDYRNLVSYFLNDFAQGSGFAWIITEKSNSIFFKENIYGFFAFEFRGSLKNARISYAIKQEFRKKGIATMSAVAVIDALKSIGITHIEADIDEDNHPSKRLIEKLGFTTNKRQVFIDPETMRAGETRHRHLWSKDLSLKEIDKDQAKIGRLHLNATQDELISAIHETEAVIEKSGQHPHLMAKYFYFLGRIRFNEGDYDEATHAFGHCNMILMQAGLPDNHETFYWFGRIQEVNRNFENAQMYYGFALEKFSNDPTLISRFEIQDAIDSVV